MHHNLTIFRMAHALASHAGTRQAVIAQNIAHADTPGYRPLDVSPFMDSFDPASQTGLRATRPQHLHAAQQGQPVRIIEGASQNSPNGNGVSLEEQMLLAVDVKRSHDRALAIYKSGLSILRTSLGRR